ncbi:MAG: hypothetical protein AAF587_22195 [Bacteroidota bacterium]
MKSLIYIFALLLCASISSEKAHAQAVFNDTILFKIVKTRATTIGAKYLLEYQTEISSEQSFSGKMVLSMCSCYCDSIWDAWPTTPSDSLMVGGTATLSHYSSKSGSSSGLFSTDGPNKWSGRLNIWQMPGSFSLTEAFTLPVTFTRE